MKPIILWGATGQSIVLEEMLGSKDYELIAIVDNDPNVISPFPGIKMLYGKKAFEDWFDQYTGKLHFSIAIGGNQGNARREIGNYLEEMGNIPVSLVHDTAFIASSVMIGKAAQVMAQSAVCARSSIGEYCIVNTSAGIDHECIIHHGVHIGPGAKLAGCVEVGENSFIGVGAIVLPRIKIGKNVIV